MIDYITEKDIKHKKYLNILSSIESKLLPHYDLGLALFNESWYAIEGKRNIIKELFKSIIINPCMIRFNINNNPLLTIATFLDRHDHDDYWNEICKDTGVHDSIIIDYKQSKKRIASNINIFEIPKKLKWLYTFVSELKQIKPFHNRIYLANELVKRKWVLCVIESKNLSPKIVMTFFDGNPDESVLIQYYKKKGAVTVTNQHGQPIFRSFEFDRMNQSQILAFKSDYYLARGEFTRKQFVAGNINEGRILLLGIVGNKNDIMIDEKSNSNKIVGVFLDSPTLPFASETNRELIDIIQQASVKLHFNYFIRLHPLDSVEKYISYEDNNNCLGIYDKTISLVDLFHVCDVSILHATATYVDSYKNGVRALKYKSNVVFPIASIIDEFENVDELCDMLTNWFHMQEEKKRELINEVYQNYDVGWYPGKTRDLLFSLID